MIHVHVYCVNGLIEVDVGTDNREAALTQALQQAETAMPGEPDCRFVAIVPRKADEETEVSLASRLGTARELLEANGFYVRSRVAEKIGPPKPPPGPPEWIEKGWPRREPDPDLLVDISHPRNPGVRIIEEDWGFGWLPRLLRRLFRRI